MNTVYAPTIGPMDADYLFPVDESWANLQPHEEAYRRACDLAGVHPQTAIKWSFPSGAPETQVDLEEDSHGEPVTVCAIATIGDTHVTFRYWV